MLILPPPSSHALTIFAPAPSGERVPVEILDLYPPLCSVRALEGKPFIGGLRWPIRTEYAVLPVARLIVSHIIMEAKPC